MDDFVMEVVQELPAEDKVPHMVDIVRGRVTLRYLRSFDADAHGGRGDIRFTDDVARAKRFPSFDAVMECWKTQSRARPLRLDGKPNRPLTAYTITPKQLRTRDA